MVERGTGALFILSGPTDSGKTTALNKLVGEARRSGTAVAGILSHKIFQKSEFVGYDIELLASGIQLPLARLQQQPETIARGRFHFFPIVFSSLLTELSTPAPALFLLDEIGPLELSGGGFAPYLKQVLALTMTHLLVVRKQCLEDFLFRFKLQPRDIITDYSRLGVLLATC
ncbi:MAG: DUF2478 domain-containing protein [Candidatus Delongbacteria bacterium]|nr:DUF2478 domain-containing protein [Candidatus Delongbacteria bacterium]